MQIVIRAPYLMRDGEEPDLEEREGGGGGDGEDEMQDQKLEVFAHETIKGKVQMVPYLPFLLRVWRALRVVLEVGTRVLGV
jgi:hypothetical protein